MNRYAQFITPFLLILTITNCENRLIFATFMGIKYTFVFHEKPCIVNGAT